MKGQLLRAELFGFLGKVVLFAVICLVFYGVGSIGIWLFNNIDSGACIFGWSMFGYCVIDSVLLTIIATIGATGAATLIKMALTEVGTFLLMMGKILTSTDEELIQAISQAGTENTDQIAETKPVQPHTDAEKPSFDPGESFEIESYICEWSGKEMKGKRLSQKSYMKEDSGYYASDIIGFVCTSCGKISSREAKESGIGFSWWSGFEKSVCTSCGNKVEEPTVILRSK